MAGYGCLRWHVKGGDGGIVFATKKWNPFACFFYFARATVCDNHFSFLANFCWKMKIVDLYTKWKIQSTCKPQWRNYLIISNCFFPRFAADLVWHAWLNFGENNCKLSNNFFIVAYTCFVSFTLHTNQQFLFFNVSFSQPRTIICVIMKKPKIQSVDNNYG